MPEQLTIGTVKFRNPVLTASGTFGMGEPFKDFLDYSKLGGITLKTVTLNPRKGNPPPRILETPAGLLNSIGLENEGYESSLAGLRKHDTLKELPLNVIYSLAGESPEDFTRMVDGLNEIEGIAMFELNLSCPNVHACGATFDSNIEDVKTIVGAVRKVSRKPFTVKFSPAQNFVENSAAAEANGADAVTISNTFVGMAIDLKKRDFVFKNKTAGYSGPAVKPIALANVYKTAQRVKIPIIASGGIASGNDALEFLFAGATFVSVGTMGFVEPDIAQLIAEELTRSY